jgi:hypothetical protein
MILSISKRRSSLISTDIFCESLWDAMPHKIRPLHRVRISDQIAREGLALGTRTVSYYLLFGDYTMKNIFKCRVQKGIQKEMTKDSFYVLLREKDLEREALPTISYVEAFPTLELVEAELKVRSVRYSSSDFQIWELRRFTRSGSERAGK